MFAIKLGYDVKILVRRELSKDKWLKSKDLDDFNLADKIIIQDFRIPKNRFVRLIKWLWLLIQNLPQCIDLYKYHILKSKFSLTWLYEWKFYKKLNNAHLFHIQYGTNKYPLDELKLCGFRPKIICSFHGHDAVFPINGFIENNGYYKNLFISSQRIVVNTKYLEELLIDLECPKELISRIPVSVDINRFRPLENKARSEIFQLITVGRMHESKGHIYLLQTMKKLMKTDKSFNLKIIGEGPERQKLENYITEHSLENLVELLGAKSQDEISELLRQSDVFVFTSITLSNGWGETQGLAVNEAMASGLPVICFDTGGVKYNFEHLKSGFLVKEGDVEVLTNFILKLFNSPKLLTQMSKSARQYAADNFSDDSVIGKWQRIYL
jgi:colanic acid/amylovoran biosynthesis glycosyltransferase